MVKKIISLVLVLAMVSGFVTVANAEANISVILDGRVLTFDQNPIIEEGRTLVPLRGIFEAMGADVFWNEETRCVTAELTGTEIKLTIGENILYKNGAGVFLDVPAQIVNSRTLVPVRAVSESFDARVDWNSLNRDVIISTDKILNTALLNAENASEIVFNINTSISYEGFPVAVTVDAGIDSRNQKFFTSYIIDALVLQRKSVSVSGEEKSYTDENGKVTVGGQQNVEMPFSFINGEGAVYTFEGETDSERIYSVDDVSLYGVKMKVKFYVSKQTFMLTKIAFPKELLSQLGVTTTSDIVASVNYNTGKTMELWNKYNK